MFSSGLILLGEILLIFFLSRQISQTIFTFFFRIFRSKTIAVSLLTVLLFPGTVIHELAHLFSAEIMGVRTGGLSFEPDVPKGIEKKEGQFSVTTGHVRIVETDPIRRYIIGTAPMFVGIIVLTAISYFLPQIWEKVTSTDISLILKIPETYYLLLIAYLLFSISNSMFSSPSDLKGIWGILIVGILVIVAGYLVGFRFELTGFLLTITQKALTNLSVSLGIVLIVNIILLIFLFLIMKLLNLFSPQKYR